MFCYSIIYKCIVPHKINLPYPQNAKNIELHRATQLKIWISIWLVKTCNTIQNPKKAGHVFLLECIWTSLKKTGYQFLLFPSDFLTAALTLIYILRFVHKKFFIVIHDYIKQHWTQFLTKIYKITLNRFTLFSAPKFKCS